MLDCGECNLRRERQRSDCCPGRESTIIRLWNTPRQVSIEGATIFMQRLGPLDWTFTGRNSPGKLAIPLKSLRVLNGILLVNIDGAAAVFKVVNVTRTHGLILNATKIDQYVRLLVDEQRRGVEELVFIKRFPAISRRESLVALTGEWI